MSGHREGRGSSIRRTVALGMVMPVVRRLSLGLFTSGHPFSGFLACCLLSGSETGDGDTLGPAAVWGGVSL